METPIIAAIIGATAALTGTLATVLMKHWETRKFYAISSVCAEAIVGDWEGEGVQEIGPNGQPVTSRVTFKFDVKGKQVTGTGKYEAEYEGGKHVMDLNCKGGFLYEKFLRLEYDPVNDKQKQFGCILVELNNMADAMEGRYLGFGPITNKPVWGTLWAKRVKR